MKKTSKIKVLFVCHGNICRSPMAEYLFRRLVIQAGLADCIETSSAATSDEELGNPVYPLAKRTLAVHGIGCREKVAQLLTPALYNASDYVIAMETVNITNIHRIVGVQEDSKVYRLLDFLPDKNGKSEQRDIEDPWYTRDFEKAWNDISAGCHALLQYLQNHERHRIESMQPSASSRM